MKQDQIQVRTEPLSDSEKTKIHDDIKTNKIVFYVVSGLFCIPVGVLIYYRGDAIPAYMFGFVLGIVVVFVGLQFRKLQKDLWEGQKRVSTGFITEKRHETRTSSSGSGSSSRTTTTHYYYIHIGAKRWDVGASHFSKLREGQKVALKEAPHSGTILGIDILEDFAAPKSAALHQASPAALDAQFDTFLSNPKQPASLEPSKQEPLRRPIPAKQALSEMEIDLLKRKRTEQMRKGLIWNVLALLGCYYGSAIPILIICLIFPALSGKLWLLTALATGALGAHFVRKRIKIYREYSAAIEANEVQVSPIKVVDKIVSNYSRILVLEDGQRFSVGEGVYGLLKVGDMAYLRRVPSLWLDLTIELPNGVCFPV